MPFGGEEDAKRLPVAVGSDLVDLALRCRAATRPVCATSFIAATAAAASLSERLSMNSLIGRRPDAVRKSRQRRLASVLMRQSLPSSADAPLPSEGA